MVYKNVKLIDILHWLIILFIVLMTFTNVISDWVHLGTLGTRGGELAAAEHPHFLG
jgi:hypothetical protein